MLTKEDQVEKAMIGLFHRLEKAELIAEDLSAKLESAEAELAELRELGKWFFECEIFWDRYDFWTEEKMYFETGWAARRELLQSKRYAGKDLRELIKKR